MSDIESYANTMNRITRNVNGCGNGLSLKLENGWSTASGTQSNGMPLSPVVGSPVVQKKNDKYDPWGGIIYEDVNSNLNLKRKNG
eukprot:UN01825